MGASTRVAILGLAVIAYANIWLLTKVPAGQRFDDMDAAMRFANAGLAIVLVAVTVGLVRDARRALKKT